MLSRVLLIIAFITTLGQAAGATEVTCEVTSAPHPADGAVDVPLNTMLAFPVMVPENPLGAPDLEITLEDGAGTAVSVELQMDIGGDCQFVYAPPVDLQAQTDYVVRIDGEVVSIFTTGAERDDVPPAFIVDEPGEGEEYGDHITFSCSDDLVLLETAFGSSQVVNYVVFSPSGQKIDDQPWIVQHLNAGQDLVLVAVDWAGNKTEVSVSGYDDGHEEALGGASLHGCSVVAPSSLGSRGAGVLALGFLGLILVLVRRRRG